MRVFLRIRVMSCAHLGGGCPVLVRSASLRTWWRRCALAATVTTAARQSPAGALDGIRGLPRVLYAYVGLEISPRFAKGDGPMTAFYNSSSTRLTGNCENLAEVIVRPERRDLAASVTSRGGVA